MSAGVLHVGFTVSDIERSVDWYSRVLGLQLIHRQRGDHPNTRQLVGIENAVIEVAQFAIPSGPALPSTHVLELIQYVEGSDAERVGAPPNRVGATHLAMIVTDIHERFERMKEEGVEFFNPPVLITEGANRGGYACYLRDPDGIRLELLQFSPERTARPSGTPPLQRVALHSVLREGHIDGYRKDHERIPEDLVAAFHRVGIHNWEIWRSGADLFHLVTCDDFNAAMGSLAEDEANRAWQASIGVHTARFEGPDSKGLLPGELIWALQDQAAEIGTAAASLPCS